MLNTALRHSECRIQGPAMEDGNTLRTFMMKKKKKRLGGFNH